MYAQFPEPETAVVTFFGQRYGYARVMRGGYPAEKVYFELEHGHTVRHGFGVQFFEQHGTTSVRDGQPVVIKPPVVGSTIRFIRDTASKRPKRGQHQTCLKWAYDCDWQSAKDDITSLPRQLRVVRVDNGKILSILWETRQENGTNAVLLLSARFPRQPDQSDGLSYTYGHRPPYPETIQEGIIIESLNEVTREWEEEDDLRFTGHLPASLTGRFGDHK